MIRFEEPSPHSTTKLYTPLTSKGRIKELEQVLASSSSSLPIDHVPKDRNYVNYDEMYASRA